MARYLVSTIEQVERVYVVEAPDEEAAFDAMTADRFIRVMSPPYEKTRRKVQIRHRADSTVIYSTTRKV